MATNVATFVATFREGATIDGDWCGLNVIRYILPPSAWEDTLNRVGGKH